ncbi:MAG: type II toxin-antitoxin system VapC family toxin [Acidimicrobiales bacterium]
MRRLLLDTTFLIDAERAGPDARARFDDDDDVAIAAVTLAELRVGALLGRGRRKGARVAFVDDIAVTMAIVDYGAEVAEHHALLLAAVRRQGRPRGAHDLIIAATARSDRRTVVTADHQAFADLPGVGVEPHR